MNFRRRQKGIEHHHCAKHVAEWKFVRTRARPTLRTLIQTLVFPDSGSGSDFLFAAKADVSVRSTTQLLLMGIAADTLKRQLAGQPASQQAIVVPIVLQEWAFEQKCLQYFLSTRSSWPMRRLSHAERIECVAMRLALHLQSKIYDVSVAGNTDAECTLNTALALTSALNLTERNFCFYGTLVFELESVRKLW